MTPSLGSWHCHGNYFVPSGRGGFSCNRPSMMLIRTSQYGVTAYFSYLHSASEMTYIVSGGALNSTHSLTQLFTHYKPVWNYRWPIYSEIGSCYQTTCWRYVPILQLINVCVVEIQGHKPQISCPRFWATGVAMATIVYPTSWGVVFILTSNYKLDPTTQY